MEREIKAIQRLVRSIVENGGTAGKMVVKRVHELLWYYAQSHDDVETQSADCPEGDPNCDPPGDG